MKHYKNHPLNPLFIDKREKELFMNLFTDMDEEKNKEVARLLFCEGVTCEQVAETTNYSKRQIERIKISLLKVSLKRAIKKLVNRSDTE